MMSLLNTGHNRQLTIRPELALQALPLVAEGLSQRYLIQRYQAGVTLIELILSMVIISIAVTGVFSVMNFTVSHSADPVVQHQAIAIAEAYLEEIQLQSYADPNGSNAGESRVTYDDVDDYNGLNNIGANDQNGNTVSNLSSYNVSVVVAPPVPISGINAKKITVTVSGPGVSGLALVGYRFNY